MGAYETTYRQSLDDPEGFWMEQSGLVDWIKRPDRAFDDEHAPFYRWYPGATLNTCYNALDRHVVAGRADQTALVYDSPVTDQKRILTYAGLLEQVAALAGALRGLGVARADRVVICMPMVPEVVVAMLACARLGAVHVVVPGGLAPDEVAARLDDTQPTVVVSASCGIEAGRVVEYKPMLDEAIERAEHRPEACVVLQRPQAVASMVDGRDIDYAVALKAGSTEPAECVEVASTDPLYVLHTSGTTGKPKGIVRDNGGHAAALAWSMANVYDVGPGDIMWTASDVGGIVGHSCLVYGPLLAGATTVLYEGDPVGTPDAGKLGRMVDEHRPSALVTSPAAIWAITEEDPDGTLLAGYDLSCLRTLFVAGEGLDPDSGTWASEQLGVPVVDHWWQTETGWPIAANLRGLEPMPLKAGSPTVPVPGYDVHVLDESGDPVPTGTDGAICLRLPLPPGTLSTLWGDDERFIGSYLSAFEGYYLTGDRGHVDEDGYVFVTGRENPAQ